MQSSLVRLSAPNVRGRVDVAEKCNDCDFDVVDNVSTAQLSDPLSKSYIGTCALGCSLLKTVPFQHMEWNLNVKLSSWIEEITLNISGT